MSRTRSRTRTATSPVNAGRRYLRDPHQMQMNLKYRVRAPSVFRHPLSLPAARLLKPSPVRRGLQPSQTGTVKEVGSGASEPAVWEKALHERRIDRPHVRTP